ncbi:amidohydrolase [Streptomyces sp. ST2-7A]|uniref:amidohydrolase family protein n=1 Tax=Streptomyces sp. ST2-7A TaxID=2907214 RepID=UPI0035AC22BE
MPLIDAHHHVWDPAVREQPWITGEEMAPLRRAFTPDDLRAVTRAAGIDATVVVQTVTEPTETPELLALAAAGPSIAGVVGWTDLVAPDVTDRIAALRAAPGGDRLVGIRSQVQAVRDPRDLLGPSADRGRAALVAHGLVHELVITSEQLPEVVEAAERAPAPTLVLDHLGKPPIAGGDPERFRAWSAGLRRLAALPHTVAKVSGLVTEADHRRWTGADLRPFVETALEAFGPDRLMFGTDWPVCLLAADHRTVLETTRRLLAPLAEGERAAVLGGTALRVYGLRPHHSPGITAS